MSSLEEVVKTLEQLDEYRNTHKAFQYKPYEYQKAFHHAKSGCVYTSGNYEVKDGKLSTQRALVCANQIGKCVTKHTVIDHPDGTQSTVGDLYESGKPFKVWAWDGKKLVEADALPPFKKPAEECFRVSLSSGLFFEASAEHRILTTHGWAFLGDIIQHSLLETNLGCDQSIHALDALHLTETTASYQDGCSQDFHLCDERPHADQDSGRFFLPSLAGVLQHIGYLCNLDDLVHKYTSNLCAWFSRHSSLDVFRRILGQSVEFLSHTFYNTSAQYPWNSQVFYPQYVAVVDQPQSDSEEFFHQDSQNSLVSPINCANQIVSYNSIGVQDIYDFSVPEYGNYYAAGVIHHNSHSAAMETTFHLTGLYPDWWEGHRFDKPVSIVVAGKRNETVRDVCQNELLGDPFEESALGTGAIPKSLIGKTTRKAGVPQALTAVMVRHVTGGWSKVRFMAFEQGPDAFMGIRFDVGWLDEEPPEDVWTQFIRGVLSRDKYCLYLTFTPEEGVTQVVDQFLNNMKAGQAVIRATWDDAAHMTDEKKEAFLAQLPPHEREMRSKGIPLMGAGLVWPISDDDISVDPFAIPSHWPRICGIDFGIDHPFAAVWIAYDRDTETKYVYDCYRESGARPPIHASAIKKRGDWIPIVWPHDGIIRDKASGIPLADSYRAEGLNLRPEKFSNPPGPGQKEGQGGNGVEVGIYDIHNAMETGTFKVFSNLTEWFEEKNQYHRKDNKIVALRDDLMSATRYASQSVRFAHTKPIRKRHTNISAGITNW